MTQNLTRAGLIDFICSQDPIRKVDDFSWASCAVGDYVRSSGVDENGRGIGSPELTKFRNTEVCIYLDGDEHPLWKVLRSEVDSEGRRIQRTYGDLQRKLIEAKLVADPNGG
jgi:hypothetical protein